MSDHKNNYCIILAGGTGSRFWPYSRQDKPKQFLDLFGLGDTMLQATYKRFSSFLPKENIFISTYETYADLVREQLPEVDASRIIEEPVQLSTAPAIALTAAFLADIDSKANIIISPADQMIVNNKVFEEQVLRGFDFVKKYPNFLALGVKATIAETTYGYLQAGENTLDGFSSVKSFTEKPNNEFARFFVESGEFYWSTSLFECSINTLLTLLKANDPYIARFLNLPKSAIVKEDIQRVILEQYPRNRYESIDMLILDHNENVYIEPCTFGWRDMGSWEDFYSVSLKDAAGNVVVDSQSSLYNCHNNVIMVPGDKIVILQDLDNYLVIEKDNILMVCKKDNSAQIRRMMNEAEVKYSSFLS